MNCQKGKIKIIFYLISGFSLNERFLYYGTKMYFGSRACLGFDFIRYISLREIPVVILHWIYLSSHIALTG
jgi:hypothetical protein